MRLIHGDPCPDCDRMPRLRMETDGRGGLVESLEEGCEHERQRRGLCQRCDLPVVGKVPFAKFCAEHRKERDREIYRESQRRRYQANAEKQRERARQWRENNPDKVREQKRRHPARRKAQQRAKRRWDNDVYQAQLQRQRDRYRNDPELRERIKRRQAEYRARKRAEQVRQDRAA